MATPTPTNEPGLTSVHGSRSTGTTSVPQPGRNHSVPLEEKLSRTGPVPPQAMPAQSAPNTPPRQHVELCKFSLYETKARYYIVGCDEAESRFRILKLDRTSVYLGKSGMTNGGTAVSTTAPTTTAAPVTATGMPTTANTTMLATTTTATTAAGSSAHTAYLAPEPIQMSTNMSHPSNASINSATTLVDQQRHNNAANGYGQYGSRSTMEEPPVVEVAAVYSREECENLLATIQVGNKATGGMHKVMDFYGVIGFVRFTEGYYMVLITRRRPVATLGGHFIYHVEDTTLLSIRGSSKLERKTEESRYVNIFQSVDLNQNFYFSYAYDLTNTLQRNMTRDPSESPKHNPMFMWNHYLVASAFPNLDSNWVLPVVHGFVDQRCLDMLGHDVYLTLIARRSRHFAGTRFLKRGANDRGYVANDVETEQIVHDTRFTSMHQPNRQPNGNPGYTAYVQHRGSIPLNWSQDTSNMARKPPIHLNVVDPYYSAAARHFDNMFARYGTPVIVLNLVKKREKTRREVILLDEFTEAVNYLNQFLPDGKIQYIAWDMSRAFKSEKEDVISMLEKIGEDALQETGFFHSGPEPHINKIRRETDGTGEPLHGMNAPHQRQHGVVRTNCIDCIDRTNAAQFVIGKCAFGHQLYALGIIERPTVEFDSDAVDALTELYHDHGNTIALQYGGSNLVNTTQTYRKMNPWSNQSRDMLEAIKRYYSNSFVDAEKQGAINLFLGNYIPHHGGPPLWELQSDHHLHNLDPRVRRPRYSYIHWYTDQLLDNQKDSECELIPPPPSGTSFVDINEEELAEML
ncbi:SacI homology domain-containing protein [Syncephalis fuscata]|nr:SacI homology domain-containing protein [Syncephalis fuscata]